ncbi:MAG: hemolysin family protein [Thermodesulfobacteriota bacterium]|nr:hemolysin family protein [Thermodesulfobacteriota bacterium]
MWDLFLAVGLAVSISAFCSIAEAVLYSTPWSRIEHLRKSGRASGNILYKLRNNIEKPIAAILTLNTVANTAGASIAGAAAARIFGRENMAYFAVSFTVLILVFSEILPKTLGVMYAKSLCSLLAKPLSLLAWILSPVTWTLGLVGKIARGKKKGPSHTEDDIRAVVSLTRKAGILKPYEELSIQNILSLDQKIVKDIMTPRTVIFSLPAQMTVNQARSEKSIWPNSRIPVFEHDDPEDIVGIVYRREVLEALADDRDDLRINDLMKPVQFVLETLTLDRLLIRFLGTRMHLFVVLDEYGGVAGVVSLEDVLEEILGKEIVDETDQVADMRALARQQREELAKSLSKKKI